MNEKGEAQVLFNKNDDDNTRVHILSQQEQKRQIYIQASKWSKRMIFVGFASTLGAAVPAGYCIGAVNNPAIHMRAWCNETLILRYNAYLSLTALDVLWASIVSIFLIGGAIGSLTGAWTANKFGRRGAFFICGILFLIGALLFYSCRVLNSVELLLLARFIVGLASGLTTSSLPLYLTEIAPLKLRGTLGTFVCLGLSGGVVVGQICSLNNFLGSELHWHIAMSAYILLVIISYAPFVYYIESPKWLYIIKGEPQLARKELEMLRGSQDKVIIEEELQAIAAESNVEQQSSNFATVLKDNTLLLPMIIVCAYNAGQQLSGINAIFYYSVSIFLKAGLSQKAAEWTNLGAGCLNLAICMLSPFLMAKINRRPLMIISTLCTTIALFAFTMALHFINYANCISIICILCIFIYIFFFQFGIGPIPFFIGAELFEVSPRPIAMSMGSLFNWGGNLIVGMAFPSLHRAVGALVFLPFSINCALLFLLTKFYLPETRGKNPAEVAPLVSKGFKSKLK